MHTFTGRNVEHANEVIQARGEQVEQVGLGRSQLQCDLVLRCSSVASDALELQPTAAGDGQDCFQRVERAV
jgi:hypothetical protein